MADPEFRLPPRAPTVTPLADETEITLPEVSVTAKPDMPAPETVSGNFDQWLRKWTLTISNEKGKSTSITNASAGYDLRMTFEIRQYASPTPGTCIVTIYNLSDETAIAAIREYSHITLQAGYSTGHYGIIFDGTIKQYKKGRESAINTYLKIYAADGDLALTKGVVREILPPGWTHQDMQDALVKNQTEYGLKRGSIAKEPLGGTINPRPVVVYGMNIDEVAAYTATTRKTWTVQQGKIVIQPATAYAPGSIPVINSGTGMIGIPEVTEEGIQVSCLLNPNLYLKQRVQLDNRTFNMKFAGGGKGLRELRPTTMLSDGTTAAFPGPGGVTAFANTAWDGIYCIVVIEHEGDTRGNDWYTHLTCWSVDGSATPQESVQGQDEVAQV